MLTWCGFERALSIPAEDLEFALAGQGCIPWTDFLLNPRRLRGSDFLMRWSQGVWSERRLIQALADSGSYVALPYGPSSAAPTDDVRSFELYFDALDKAGLGTIKRPDLLVFRKSDEAEVRAVIRRVTRGQSLPFVREDDHDIEGIAKLPFISEEGEGMRCLLSKAVVAVECENSLWKAKQMPAYGAKLRPMRRLGGELGLPSGAVLPTVILKEEDREPLARWQDHARVPIHIWHVFYDLAFGLSFDDAEGLIRSGRIRPTQQVFQAPGGATSTKTIYKVYYHHAYTLAESEDEPTLIADCVVDKNGHILPYVRFDGGRLAMSPVTVAVLDGIARLRDGERG